MARKRGLSTVQQALRLLAYLADHPEGVGAKEVARLLGKSLSSAYALLHSLMEEGFVVKEEGASARAAKARPLGAHALGGGLGGALPAHPGAVLPRPPHPQGVRLKTRGRQGQLHPLGETLPPEWHALALGKVLLAFGDFPLPPSLPRPPTPSPTPWPWRRS